MKLISLSQNRFAKVDDEDFEFLSRWKWQCCKQKNGRYYAVRSARKAEGKQKTIRMHRVIMNTPPGLDVDHKYHDGLNNQKCDMRNVTRSQNSMNQRLQSKSKSGYKGVVWHKRDQKWQARIRKGNNQIQLGYYASKEEAALAYNKAATRLFGDFACLNNI